MHISERMKKLRTKAAVMAMGVSTAVMSMTANVYADNPAPAGESWTTPGIDASGVKNGMIQLFKNIGLWAGFFYLVGAVFALVLALRNEDTEGRNKALMNMIAAIVLLSFGAVLSNFGLNA